MTRNINGVIIIVSKGKRDSKMKMRPWFRKTTKIVTFACMAIVDMTNDCSPRGLLVLACMLAVSMCGVALLEKYS